METEDVVNRQFLVDEAILLKVVSDYYTDRYKSTLGEYAEHAFASARMPKGDASEFGDVTIVYSKATDEELESVFSVTDLDALKADSDEDFAEYVTRWVGDHLPTIAEDFFMEVGAIPDGCEVTQRVKPAQPRTFKYVKTNPDKEFKHAVRTFLDRQAKALEDGIAGQIGE